MHARMNRPNSFLDWVLSHWAHFTVLRLIFMATLSIIFLPCGFYLSFFLLSSFFSSPNLSCRRLDVCHTSTHDVALVRI